LELEKRKTGPCLKEGSEEANLRRWGKNKGVPEFFGGEGVAYVQRKEGRQREWFVGLEVTVKKLFEPWEKKATSCWKKLCCSEKEGRIQFCGHYQGKGGPGAKKRKGNRKEELSHCHVVNVVTKLSLGGVCLGGGGGKKRSFTDLKGEFERKSEEPARLRGKKKKQQLSVP